MAALTSAITVQGDPNGSPKYGARFNVAASTTIYVGSLVFINSSGNAVSTSPDQTMTCAGYHDGMCSQGRDIDNSTGAAGDETIVPRIGEMDLTNGAGGDAISADDVGKMAYASDNQTANLTSSSGTRAAIGPIIGMNGTKVRVVAGAPGNREIAGFTAVSSAPVLTSTSTSAFSAEVNLGALADGFLAIDVTAGTAAVTNRSIAVTGAGLSIANGDGQAGNPTISLANGVAALEALAGTGIVVHTAADTYTERSVAVSGAGLSIVNGDGVAGNPTLALADDIAALEGIAGTGLLARTGAGTAAARTLTAPAAGITVTDGDGVAGNPTLVLANDLAALEALDATAGILVKTAAETYSRRTLQAPAAGFTITNPAGTAGDPTFVLANDLAAFEALDATGGILVKTAAETYTRRSIGVGSTGLSVTNGDGIAGNPTLDNLFAPIQVADPGTGVAIPVTRSATISMTIGAGVETNTAAIPTFDGQSLRLYAAATGGGTRAITFASAINVAGNTIATFNAARDYLVVHAIRVGAVLAWEVALNVNVVLS